MTANVSQYGFRCGTSHHTNLLPFFDRITAHRAAPILVLLKAIWLHTALSSDWKTCTEWTALSWKVVLNRRTWGSLQIITKPQACNAVWWEKLANATHKCIIKEYEVKEGKWFWVNDSYYYTLSTYHFHASRKMWNTAGNSKTTTEMTQGLEGKPQRQSICRQRGDLICVYRYLHREMRPRAIF